MKKRGFTLIELLVVITVIAILIMILLPALSSVKKMAGLAQCSANKHDIGIAVLGYVSDFGDAWWVSNEYDMPWEGPRDGGNGALFSIGGTNTGCWAYGNPAVAITRDFDPYLATALQSMNKPLSDGVYAMANKQNYLSSAKYFFCPLSYYTYQKNYGRYGSEFTSPTNPNLMWGTDTWYYNHKYDPANEADPGHLNFITYQHSNPESATVLLSDFHSYNWCDPATPYMLQQKPHWNFLMLDGSVKPFTDIKKVFAFMWSNQPAARNQVFDETGCSGPLPPWTPGL